MSNLAPPATSQAAVPKKDASTGGKLNATGYVENGRLKLTADVSLEEIDALREMLEGYKTILKFMN